MKLSINGKTLIVAESAGFGKITEFEMPTELIAQNIFEDFKKSPVSAVGKMKMLRTSSKIIKG
jgi:hypothetical protein